MADLKIRFNSDNDDIEIVLDDKVIDTVGTEVVESWVTAYNEKHGFVKPNDGNTEEDSRKETSTDAVDTETQE